MTRPSIDNLERAVARRNHGEAIGHLVAVLREIDRSYGRTSGIDHSPSRLPLTEREQTGRFATRLAAATGALVADAGYRFTEENFADLIVYHRWINLIFEISTFQSGEHLVSQLATDSAIGDHERLLRILAIFPTHALAQFNLANFLGVDESATCVAALNFVASRYCFSTNAYDLRERLLEWLPGRLANIELKHVRPDKLVEPYMMCSYATTQRKHEIKSGIIELMRRACLDGGCAEWNGSTPPKRDRPVIFVATEAFGAGHSVFRTHSRSVLALREKFHVIGICFEPSITAETRECFDEILLYAPGPFVPGIKSLTDTILERQPDMVLQLGVGMAPHTIALASLRIAPVQVASFAHTATSNSRFVDHMVLPSDFVRDPRTFVEPLLMVPPGAMPYALRPDGEAPSRQAREQYREPAPGEPIRIGLPAAIMKLNPRLFATLERISSAGARKVEIHLFPLASVGLARIALEQALEGTNVLVHEELPYDKYLGELGQCDFFLCPFPYGNVNSVVDCIRLGLPGVCLDDVQPHAHADASLFRRAGLPEELIAQDLDGYVAAATRLVEDDSWRAACRAAALAANLQSPDFNGDPSVFCDALYDLLQLAGNSRPQALLPDS